MRRSPALAVLLAGCGPEVTRPPDTLVTVAIRCSPRVDRTVVEPPPASLRLQ